MWMSIISKGESSRKGDDITVTKSDYACWRGGNKREAIVGKSWNRDSEDANTCEPGEQILKSRALCKMDTSPLTFDSQVRKL